MTSHRYCHFAQHAYLKTTHAYYDSINGLLLPASGHKGSASFAIFNGLGGSGLAMDSSTGFSVDVEEVR